MSQQHAAELCALLVNDIYGEVSSKVVSILLQLGRLPIPQICSHIKLGPKIVKQTLVVLIQQHIVTHYTHSENHRDVVYYETNWMQIYELLHAGRIIRAMESRYGNDGALIISNMLQLGHARVSDFLSAYGTSTKKAGQDAEDTITSVETLKSVITEMVASRFLIQVQEHHMNPPTDTINAMRKSLTAQLRKNFTVETRLVKEVDRQIAIKMAEFADGDTNAHAGMKRKLASSAKGKAKKRAKVSMYDQEVEEEEWEVDEEVVLRVNHEKFLVLFRNQELVSLAEKRLGKTTSLVYGQFLEKLEPKYLRCHVIGDDDEEEDNPKKRIKLSVLELSKTFDFSIELDNSIAAPPKEVSKGRKRSLEDSDDESPKHLNGNAEDDDEDEEEDEWADHEEIDDADPEASKKKKRMAIIKQHLQLLAEDSFKFLKHESTRGMGEWSINYKELGKLIKQLEVEKVVEERFGSMGTRLLRIVKDKGKLDEKQIANIALLKQKEIRATLSGLHEAGHLELQEVPKTATPQVSRMFFLWFYDFERAKNALIGDVYKAMARCIQRTNTERDKRKSLLEKWERTDVQANQEEYLTTGEKRELEIWSTREEKLLAQLMRLDRIVMIMRDF
ncbi:uncharacterized protein H6S33_011319 [Morchella sextelata]|uniref:uncharacterized protein n=1 Tax=Morchella sextelata TaxID=1174677 RepID=UPI001D037E46|nr:uncharacterized protein H6S33_011319 [Morchella sextelata]KAH0610892.1 hypothetical protein H6S33_011319 [Morchella sextelata]